MESTRAPFFVVLVLGLIFAGYYFNDSTNTQTAEGREQDSVSTDTDSRKVWTGEKKPGKSWTAGNAKINFIDRGFAGSGGAIQVSFAGPGWQGGGVNWKGWQPEGGGDDYSKYNSLIFFIRQESEDRDADVTINLQDSNKRPGKEPHSNPVSVVADGMLTRIDGEWRKVVIPLERFASTKDLDLKKLWGIDFSITSGKTLAFHIDQVQFGNECGSIPKFPKGGSYEAMASLDFNAPGHSISEMIYGVCDLPSDKARQLGVLAFRHGGNRSSRYNPHINADNAGKDWFFKNRGFVIKDASESMYAKTIHRANAVGGTAYVTVSMLGYVSKDYRSHGFSVKKYGAQDQTESGHPDAGNGISRGDWITKNDWEDTSVKSTPQFIADAVKLTAQATKGMPRIWVLDNEPMLWHETHRDVRKSRVSYDELWELTLAYAEAIRAVDPESKIAGFCSWGWKDLFFSAADESGETIHKADYAKHDSMPIAEWFIKKCGDYKKAKGKALIDIFDFHWYPQAVDNADPYEHRGMSDKLNRLRMRSTRDLWDTEYEPQSWTKTVAGGGPTALIPRVRAWIEKHNPGMQLCVGEYNFGGYDNISGALAQTDALGVFAREKTDYAFIWNTPMGTQELAWKLMRNYDGNGNGFGNRYIPGTCKNRDVSVYAAKRSDGATTIVVINKNLSDDCQFKLDTPGLRGQAKLYRFDQDSECKVMEVKDQLPKVDGQVTLKLPAASATMIVVK